ncbi:MAG: TAT-variant-translocated molybdopterin oxidoreductase [Fidelibacterota bacterium]|nr:MAG: TAT-variant-translocated molybdopterin oxidoreductase [Candidatus Neomarinimicrobiota bacterium]
MPPVSKVAPETASDRLPKDGQAYWRSLKEIADTPEFQALLQDKPTGKSGTSGEGISRRNFLNLMAASLALAGMAGCRRPVEKIVPYVIKPEEIIPGIPQYYATSMPLAGEVYHLLAESHEGRPTQVIGNSLNQVSRGSANVWATASILGLYDPDRSRKVRHADAESTLAAFIEKWQELYSTHRDDQGAGLAVLTESFASLTLSRLADEFKQRFPEATWCTYEPVSDENITRGIEVATGESRFPVYHFDRADIILALDADFLGLESHQYAHALGFAEGRRMTSEQDKMNRLYVVESTLSQTATMADHRLVLQSRQVGAFLAALCLEIQRQGLDLPITTELSAYKEHPFDAHWLRVVAEDLLANRGRSLVLAGRRQPPAVHALVAVLNRALGNQGRTVDYRAIPYHSASKMEDLKDLVSRMEAGTVNTLVILGGNPVYNAPADVDFQTALAKVPDSLHLSPYYDETSQMATWHIPQHHYLESWSDAASLDGYLSIIQPLIRPFYTGLSSVELLALLVSGEQGKGYDEVRSTWRNMLPSGSFEKQWRKILHDGLYAREIPDANVRVRTRAVASFIRQHPFPTDAATGKSLEIVFQPSPTVHDGRFANNGWLQELPDPVTKITWDNAAIISKRTAQELGLRNQELVYLSYRGKQLTAPVWIMPGQADHSITLTLGYGRKAAGRIGSNVGFNAYRLQTSDAPCFDDALTLRSLHGIYDLACLQDHHGLDDEMLAAEGVAERLPLIIREATLDEYRRHPDFARERVEHPPLKSMWEDHRYDEGYQWGMVIDLNACTGCGACTVACQSENNIPIVGKAQVMNGREMHWIRIDRYFSGSAAEPAVVAQPVGCVHCEMAPCESVCPVAATIHDEEGLNTMAYNRCVGTRYCSNNCPYKVRRFNFFNYTKDLPEIVRHAQNPDVTVRSRGVMEKCTYCVQRINLGKREARQEGRDVRDGDIQMACQQACPTQAITFGNLNDPDSQVSQLKDRNRNYDLLGELNLRPRTSYLAKLRNPNPKLEEQV